MISKDRKSSITDAVKAAPNSSAAASIQSAFLLLMVAFAGSPLTPYVAHAQVSEKDVQSLEQQEFGIDSPGSSKPKPPQQQIETELGDTQIDAEPEKINPIEAEEFNTRLKKTSRSGRVLLLEDLSENRPRPGKILLLKRGKDDVAAVRVLKNMPGKFAAKIVLSFATPELNQEFRALKKLGDKIMSMIKEREKRGKDLDALKSDEELAKEVSPDDNELDRGIPAQKPKTQKDAPAHPPQNRDKMPEPLFNKDGSELNSADGLEIQEEDEPYADLSVQEDLPLEPHRHAVSLQYGAIRNINNEGNATTYNGLGARYAFNFGRMLLFKKKHLQDMMSLEVGVFYYSVTGFEKTEDSITVLPIIGTFRYNLLVGENLSFYPYIGFVKNNVSSAEGALTANTQRLATTKAAMGVGGMLKIGPSWAVRIDAGTDLFGIGGVLKF